MARLELPSRFDLLKGEGSYSVMAQANSLEAQGRSIIHLEIGQPDFPTPSHVCDAASRAIAAGRTKYNPALGIPELRAAIARHVSSSRGVSVSPDMVAVTPSGKTAIFLAMLAILERGDEVIYPNPGFPVYEDIALFLGAIPRPVPILEDKNFSFDVEVFEKLVNPKTKLVILNSPGNPTGGIIPQEHLEKIHSIIKNKPIWVLSDEIYSAIVYERKNAPTIYTLSDMKEKTFLVDGFSKTYSMTGWRLGYLVFPEGFAPHFSKLLVNTVGCTATFVQDAGVVALEGPTRDTHAMVAELKRRRDYLVDQLNKIPGFSCLRPAGAFYTFPNIRGTGRKSQELATAILEKAGVALLPGTAFGKHGEGYLRLAYTTSLDNLKEGVSRISDFVKSSI